MADERPQNNDRPERIQKYFSICASIASFWLIALFWNYVSLEALQVIPRLGLGAALSWVVFQHTEVTGMIIMSMMKEKWQSDAREDARMEALENVLIAALTESREARAEAREERAEAREALAEAMAEAREERAAAREREAAAREREARAQETIVELIRRLDRNGGEKANGA